MTTTFEKKQAFEIEPTEWGIANVWYQGYMVTMHVQVEGFVMHIGADTGVTSNTSQEWQTITNIDNHEMNNFEMKHIASQVASMFDEALNEFDNWDFAHPYASLREGFEYFVMTNRLQGTFHYSPLWCVNKDKEVFTL